jgi:metal-sulfur cluster biosynthetic enzyme
MTDAPILSVRLAEVWARLDRVMDPELDEPVTEMGFVEQAGITVDGAVEVDFRLPTYWCSPNFAFLMLDGVRTALERLSWSPPFRVTLHDHMFAEEVNRGIADSKSFGEIFDALAGDLDLEELRETFRVKAFKRRQEAVLRGLRKFGLADRDILAMTVVALEHVQLAADEPAKQKPRYLEALRARFPCNTADSPAFVTSQGHPIEAAALSAYLAELRSIRINMEFNGALCRGLKQSRYKELDVVDGEPTLVDFIMDRVPAQAAPNA